MKRLILVALAVLFAAPLSAQESYTINASAGQVADVSAIATGANLVTCTMWGLSPGCTQAAACTAANAAGGASCTAGQARAANARIFPLTQAGREEFVTFKIAAPEFISMKNDLPRLSPRAYCAWFGVQTQGTQDAECTKIGLSAGCTCPAQ